MGRFIRILMLVSILVPGLALAGCSAAPAPAPAASPPSDIMAPDFQLQTLDGKTISLSDLRGKPVMLNFWASWCGPCREEMPYLQQVFEDKAWSDRGLVILAVNLGEPASRVKEFIGDNGFSFTVLLDTGDKVAGAYHVNYIPATYFIDKNGIIKSGKIGPFASKAEIDQRLAAIAVE